MDGGAWWATIHGLANCWTQLSDFTFTFHWQVNCEKIPFRKGNRIISCHISYLCLRILAKWSIFTVLIFNEHFLKYIFSITVYYDALIVLGQCQLQRTMRSIRWNCLSVSVFSAILRQGRSGTWKAGGKRNSNLNVMIGTFALCTIKKCPLQKRVIGRSFL